MRVLPLEHPLQYCSSFCFPLFSLNKSNMSIEIDVYFVSAKSVKEMSNADVFALLNEIYRFVNFQFDDQFICKVAVGILN